jgi:hypothetical protein
MIPLIFLIAMIVISYVMYREYVKRKRVMAIKKAKEDENRFIIERVVMRDMLNNEAWWLTKDVDTIRCSFNRALYVEFLESK